MTFNVYTLRDRAGAPLYVGVTRQLGGRLSHHRYNQPWWRQVSFLTVEASAPSQVIGEAYEWAVIQILAPRYNVRGTDRKGNLGGWATRRAQQQMAHARGERCWRLRKCDEACRSAVPA